MFVVNHENRGNNGTISSKLQTWSEIPDSIARIFPQNLLKNLALSNPRQALEQIRQKLFLARYDAGKFPDVRTVRRETDAR